MSTIVTRAGKGSPLTNTEVDDNFTNLNNDKLEIGGIFTIPVGNGGTGATSLAANNVLLGNGTSALQTVAPGSSGNVLTSDGTSWTSAPASGGASAITISNKTGAYTVVSGDLGTIINCTSGTFTVSLTAAATLGAGFNCWIWNTSTTSSHVITIDPDGAETIDGITTLILRRGEGMQIVCDGTNWQTGDKKVMRGYSENITVNQSRPTASGSLDVAIGAGANATGGTGIALGFDASTTAARGTAIGTNSGANGSRVVTGSGAMALGGSYASGTDSFAAAVANNTSSYGATGANSVAIGRLAKATGASACAFGSSSTGNVASGNNSFAQGVGSTASGVGSIALIGGTSSGYSSIVIGVGNDNGVQYRRVYGSNAGVQNSDFILWDDTTDATPTVISTNGNAAGISVATQLSLPNNSAYAFSGTIIARQQAAGGSDYAAWEVKGAIIRDANAASTSLGTYNINILSKTAGASAWDVALSADTTNGGLAVTVTGAAATNIRWVATIQTSEVTYA